MPAISTTRRNWISPQFPRTPGVRSAVTSLPVSARSWAWVSRRLRTCSWSAAYAPERAFSNSWILESTFSSDARTGVTMARMACCRISRSPRAACWVSASADRASERNAWLLRARASEERALKAASASARRGRSTSHARANPAIKQSTGRMFCITSIVARAFLPVWFARTRKTNTGKNARATGLFGRRTSPTPRSAPGSSERRCWSRSR